MTRPKVDDTAASEDGLPILGFADAAALGRWLAAHHAESPGFWLKIAKAGSGERSPSYGEALDEALRFGWIDGQKAKLDAAFYLQRFTPRRRRSRWSKINRGRAEALIANGRMERAGQVQVDAARADGRWDAAYDSHRTAGVPDDLAVALDADPAARAFFDGLSAQNRYAILHRVQEAKRPETRARRIAKYVAMCARHETLH